MSDPDFYDIDQSMAKRLLASLQLKETDASVNLAAKYLARHRQSAYSFSAQRAHSNIIRILEIAAMANFRHRGGDWMGGFCSAEQQVMIIPTANLLKF
jgi:hypothetical protein